VVRAVVAYHPGPVDELLGLAEANTHPDAGSR